MGNVLLSRHIPLQSGSTEPPVKVYVKFRPFVNAHGERIRHHLDNLKRVHICFMHLHVFPNTLQQILYCVVPLSRFWRYDQAIEGGKTYGIFDTFPV